MVTEITEQVRRGRPLLAGCAHYQFPVDDRLLFFAPRDPAGTEFAQVPSLLGRTSTHGWCLGVGWPVALGEAAAGGAGLPWAHPPLALLSCPQWWWPPLLQ
ncbi:MAG: hypothetical protein U1U88_001609 [Lawsonella clevelandensis]